MGIQVIGTDQIVFHISGGNYSYVMGLTEELQLVHLYYGPYVDPKNDFSQILNQSQIGFSLQFPSGVCYEKLALEYGSFGKYSLKEESFSIRTENHLYINDFEYEGYKVLDEKPTLLNLPNTYDGSKTLIITLKSKSYDLSIELLYTLFEGHDVLVKSSRFINRGQEKFLIEKALSASYGFLSGNYDVTTFNGRWIKEFTLNKQVVKGGKHIFDSLLGVSTHSYQPYVALSSVGATENSGHVYGFALVYNGNHQMTIEKDIFNQMQLSMGIHPHCFSWQLNENEIFETPEVISAHSSDGFNGLSQKFHAFLLSHLMRKLPKSYSKVQVNSWEAMYFDIDEKKIVDLGRKAHHLGIEMLVIDDGWFTGRKNDQSGLGPWTVDYEKFPEGLKVLGEKTGLEIGLWFEPEMTNDPNDSVIGIGKLTASRNQYVLDFTDESVVNEVFRKMCSVLDASNIRWIKWDANRPITEPYSKSIRHQGELYHRYQMGVYRLAQMLIDRYPDLEIESCSAGGGRAGLGMFAYANSTWLSDQTDAVERLSIQQSASLFLPLRAMGAHVTQCPNHQVLRTTPLKMRNDVAIFGTFGYELNLLTLNELEEEQIKEDILKFKAHRELIQTGSYYRIMGVFTESTNDFAHMVLSKDGSSIILGVYQVLAKSSWEGINIPLHGLDLGALYTVENHSYTGDFLRHIGLPFKKCFTGVTSPSLGKIGTGDFSSQIIHLKKEGIK